MDEKHLERLLNLGDDKTLALHNTIKEAEAEITERIENVESKLEDISDALKKKSEEELLYEVDENKIVENVLSQIPPPKDGKDAEITEQLKEEIATLAMMDIEVPIVEKVIEKRTEVIREQPIVTEIVKEVAVSDTAETLRDKLETLEGDERLDAKAIKNLPVATKEIIRMGGGGNVEVFSGDTKVGSSQRLRFTGATVTNDADGAVKVTVTGGSGTPGGNDGDIQYNDNGVFNGKPRLPFSQVSQIAGLSLLGVTGSSTANMNAITATSDHQVIRRSGNSVAFGAINLASSNAVTGTLPNANLDTVGIAKGGTGQTTANAALNALLPSQTLNSGKFLKTDGTNTSWEEGGSGYTSHTTASAVTSTSTSTSDAVTSVDFGAQSYSTSSFVTSISDNTAAFVQTVS